MLKFSTILFHLENYFSHFYGSWITAIRLSRSCKTQKNKMSFWTLENIFKSFFYLTLFEYACFRKLIIKLFRTSWLGISLQKIAHAENRRRILQELKLIISPASSENVLITQYNHSSRQTVQCFFVKQHVSWIIIYFGNFVNLQLKNVEKAETLKIT